MNNTKMLSSDISKISDDSRLSFNLNSHYKNLFSFALIYH